MLNRRITNVIRFIMDEFIPPIIRDNKYFMYPLFCFWYKGGVKVKMMMNLKSNIHNLNNEEYAKYYGGEGYISNRLTDLSEPTIKFIIDHLGSKTDTIVDIGCGKGYLLKRLYDEGYHSVQGIDLVSASIYEEINIINGNIEELPLKDKQFDIVICNHTLEHVLDLHKAVLELKRVARKKLIVTVPKQRYYHYTLDEHINFFPEISYLLKALEVSDNSAEYKNIDGDFTVILDINNL